MATSVSAFDNTRTYFMLLFTCNDQIDIRYKGRGVYSFYLVMKQVELKLGCLSLHIELKLSILFVCRMNKQILF